MSENKTNNIIKPNYGSFILLGPSGFILPTLLILAGVFLLLSSVDYAYYILATVSLVLFLVFFLYIHIMYKKESYILGDNKIIYNHGTIFSDSSTEVDYQNIMQVLERLGFVERILFKTGSVLVRTAGSSGGAVYLRSIDDTSSIYAKIQQNMQKSGYSLKKDKLVVTEKPHPIGAIGETLGGLITSIIIFFYMIIGFSEEINTGGLKLDEYDKYLNTTLIGIIVIYGLIISVWITLKYLDIKRRVYTLYSDMIEFHEGFMTKYNSFIPIESISDVDNTQGFFSKIFGIHDIVISSEGGSNEVHFFNIVNGKKMVELIKATKNHFSYNKPVDTIEVSTTDISSTNTPKPSLEDKKSNINFNTEFKATYTQDFRGVAIKSLPLILLFIVPYIWRLITTKFYKYTIGDRQLESEYSFLSTHYTNFSVDKITMIDFHQTFIDRWLGICTIRLYSIGNTTPLIFRDIKYRDGLYDDILSKMGIYRDDTREEIEIDFSFTNLLLSRLSNILLVIFTLSLYFWYKKLYYSEKFYTQNTYKDFIESHTGVLIQNKKYALFADVKGLQSRKYPFINTGRLTFDISGELIINFGKNSTKIFKNTISMPFVRDVFSNMDRYDSIVLGAPLDESSDLQTKKQSIINSIFGYLILLLCGVVVLIFGLMRVSIDDGMDLGVASELDISMSSALLGISVIMIFIAIVSIILVVIYIRFISYNLYVNRIMKKYGVIYKSRSTILYSKIDFINMRQGLLNKIFRNGSIYIFTKASSGADMGIVDIDGYTEFYEKLKEK